MSSKPTITEFLLARIAEDEARAGDAFDHWGGPGLEYFECDEIFGVAISRSRLLAECKAKREIVEQAQSASAHAEHPQSAGLVTAACDREWRYALRILAAVYADHPDYDPRWAA